MIEIKNILCPIDLSEVSRHALDHAVAIARWYQARVTALFVVPPVMSLLPPGATGLYGSMVLMPSDLKMLEDRVAAFVGEAHHAGVRIDPQVAEGGIVGEIIRTTTNLPADLLVMGTHGRSGFERLLLGSVTEKMLRKAPCPLLTVPPRAEAPPSHVEPFRRILCAIDLSPSSLRALTFAESLAEEADADLVVMHVLEPASVFEPVAATGFGGSPSDVARNAMRQRLDELISSDARTYSRVAELVAEGKPHVEILRVAAARTSELIVLGAHGGHPGLPAFGSTTNHIVREATCPVLTVRA